MKQITALRIAVVCGILLGVIAGLTLAPYVLPPLRSGGAGHMPITAGVCISDTSKVVHSNTADTCPLPR